MGLGIQQHQASYLRLADPRQIFEKLAQQLVEILRFELRAKQVVKGLRLRFADLIKRVVEGENHAEVQLLACPVKIGVLLGKQLLQQGVKNRVVSAKRADDLARRDVQLSQTPSAVLYLLEEVRRGP